MEESGYERSTVTKFNVARVPVLSQSPRFRDGFWRRPHPRACQTGQGARGKPCGLLARVLKFLFQCLTATIWRAALGPFLDQIAKGVGVYRRFVLGFVGLGWGHNGLSRANRFGWIFAVKRRVGVPILVFFKLIGILVGVAADGFVEKQDRHFGHVHGHRQRHAQPH